MLGCPASDTLNTYGGVGRYNSFAGGSIYWAPSLGAHYLLGAILMKWATLGSERSRLGYPISDEFTVPGGQRVNFQHGYIGRNLKTGGIVVAYS